MKKKDKIKIITDSAGDITLKKAAELDIAVLPMNVTFGEDNYKDGRDLTNEQFYKLLEESSHFPKTSMVNPEDIKNEFLKNKDEYDHQIFVSISSLASGTSNTASVIAEELREEYPDLKITVLDSMAFTYIYGAVVIDMAAAAKNGASYNEIMKIYNRLNPLMDAYFIVGSLNHLQRGGRIHPGVAIIGNLLGIKPLLNIRGGLVNLFARERSAKKATHKIISLVSDSIDLGYHTVYIANAGAKAEATEFEADLKRKLNVHTEHINIGACIGAHCGPGLVGVIFKRKK